MDFFRAGNILAWLTLIIGLLSFLNVPLELKYPERYPYLEYDPLQSIWTGIVCLYVGVAMGILVRIGRAVTGARQTQAVEQQPNPWMRENQFQVSEQD